MPNHMMPSWLLLPLRQSRKAAVPSMLKAMAKLDGRNAALAWNMPGLATSTSRNSTATRGLKALAIAVKSLVSLKAVKRPRQSRTK